MVAPKPPYICPIESCQSFSWWSGTSPNDGENWDNPEGFLSLANRKTWSDHNGEQLSLGGPSNKDQLVPRSQVLPDCQGKLFKLLLYWEIYIIFLLFLTGKREKTR